MKHIKKIKGIINKFVFTKIARLSVKKGTNKFTANFFTWLSKNTVLGKNDHFNGMKIGGAGLVKIGDNFHSGKGCLMITSFHDYEGKKIPYDETSIHKDIIIEDNVWLGDRIIILGGVTLGEGSIIQAGSVVVTDIPKYSVAGGHPAKVFKYRDIDHYKRLKDEGKFF